MLHRSSTQSLPWLCDSRIEAAASIGPTPAQEAARIRAREQVDLGGIEIVQPVQRRRRAAGDQQPRTVRELPHAPVLAIDAVQPIPALRRGIEIHDGIDSVDQADGDVLHRRQIPAAGRA